MTQIARRPAGWRGTVRVGAIVTVIAALLLWMGGALIDAAGLVFGAAVVAFLAEPLARLFERRLGRSASALCALGTLFAALALAAWLLLPALIAEIVELARGILVRMGKAGCRDRQSVA